MPVFGMTYKDTIILEIKTEENTEENIHQARLLRKYIKDYKSKIGELETRYSIGSSFVLNAYKKELDTMIQALKKTETKFMDKADAESIRLSVVEWLKDLNVLIKDTLKKEQDKYEERLKIKKASYARIGDQISKVIRQLTKELTSFLSQKENLSEAQKEIIRSLVRHNETNNKIEDFRNLDFQSEEEMKWYYRNIIRSIRSEIKQIKSLLKQG